MGVGSILMFFSPGSWILESGVLKITIAKAIAAVYIAHWIAIPPMSLLRASKEDEILREEFGAEWQTWAQNTPYKIIPFMF